MGVLKCTDGKTWSRTGTVHLPPITIVPSFIDLTSFDHKSRDGTVTIILSQEVPRHIWWKLKSMIDLWKNASLLTSLHSCSVRCTIPAIV